MASGEKQTSQYLTFSLDHEIFALNIETVREVLDVSTLTRVPRMPAFMCGVINLRGSAVAVIDMRRKFSLPAADETVNTCIIICEVTIDGEGTVLGCLVDAVQEVLELDQQEIEPPPRMGTRLETNFLLGMGRRGEQFILLLDLDRVFSSDDLLQLQLPGQTEAAAGV
ncbi:MAG: chemotaxis protein CheW [Desulfuromonas thiophila]|jgi:purine-binding chemotaxis protein CheW|nr:chemotaxis protein CheW [Desulfuromonas thiophila]MDD3802634.1 chemotaxis protein CheW [Desulfuromonas thiophila]MDY0397983.1 chemotaxis protein CheW [Desulfuromonas thiophila]